MPCDTSNVKLGPCTVKIDGEDIGLTKGGVTLSISTTSRMLNDNHFGSVLPDRVITKREIMIKIPFAESTMENMLLALPGSAHTVNASKERLDVYEAGGTLLRENAVELVLQPVGSSNENQKVTIPLAVTDGTTSLSWQIKKERVFEVEFQALENANGLMMFFGDATA